MTQQLRRIYPTYFVRFLYTRDIVAANIRLCALALNITAYTFRLLQHPDELRTRTFGP